MSQYRQIMAARFEELFSDMPKACFTFDRKGIIQAWNGPAESLLGSTANEALFSPVWQTLGAASDGLWSSEFVRSIFKGKPVAGHEWLLKTGSSDRHLVCDIFPIKSSGKIIGAVCANTDVTERKEAELRANSQLLQFNELAVNLEHRKAVLERANLKLEKLSITDGLTGLCNHRRFHEEIDRIYAKRDSSMLPVSVVLIDLDNFKEVNDTFGHPEGDVILRFIAKILQRVSRTNDCVARYGGEEFAVILRGTGPEAAWAAAERFRAAIAETTGPLRNVTASVGVATQTADDSDARVLIGRADRALYLSKQNGRNRTTHSDGIGDLPQLEVVAAGRAA